MRGDVETPGTRTESGEETSQRAERSRHWQACSDARRGTVISAAAGIREGIRALGETVEAAKAATISLLARSATLKYPDSESYRVKTSSRQNLLSAPLGGLYSLFKTIMQQDIPEMLFRGHPWTATTRTISYPIPLSSSMAPSLFPPTRSCFVSTPTLSGLKLLRGQK